LLVAILREAPPAWRVRWLEGIRKIAPAYARLCEEYDFIYRDLSRLDDRGAQLAWRVIAESEWLLAWKLTDDDVKETMLRNLSARKREDFLKAFAAQPKVPRRQVIQVQRLIAQRVRALVMQGKAGLKSRRADTKKPGRSRVSKSLKKND
jgi:flagellar motor switch protein FliG